ncbi:hypothetical protein [Halalkalicoccus tibetensis]|uniref:Uncharacterized protein n=1 Tax=Halalkalicoccus tibetensis TaxID=175632 RepID=A0ABD5V560_9EURY
MPFSVRNGHKGETNHPAACATTLIVVLGLLTGPINIGIIMGSVVLLYVLHEKVLYPTAKYLGFEPEDSRPVNDDDEYPHRYSMQHGSIRMTWFSLR